MTSIDSSSLRTVVQELRKLHAQPLEGVRLLINEQDLTDIQAWIHGPTGTPYENGYFRLRLRLERGFPQAPPKCFFETKIFHPNVSADGEVCVNTLKKDWRPTLGLGHIFLTIKCLLIAPNPESALNEEAGRLLLECYEDYAKHARLMTDVHGQSLAGRRAFGSGEDESDMHVMVTCETSVEEEGGDAMMTTPMTDASKVLTNANNINRWASASGANSKINKAEIRAKMAASSASMVEVTEIRAKKRSAMDGVEGKMPKQTRVAKRKVAGGVTDKKRGLRRL